MSDDHRAVIKKATELVKKIGVSPKDNAESKALMERATKEKESLNALSGTAFDKAYIDNEVAFHKAVIHSVNTELLPHAKNSELKNFLTSIIPSLEAHLAHAEEIQKNFKDKP